jgi:hypothetical protein
MITKYGMDPEVGLVVYPDDPSSDFSFYKPYSEETAQMIDEKVKMYLEDAYKVAKNTILEHKETMEKIAELLIKKEYISGEDFSMMVENPDKIDEFRDADEIVTKAEENNKSEVKQIINKVEKTLRNVKVKKDEKNTDKKPTSRKKA